jgi:hypothetical protein
VGAKGFAAAFAEIAQIVRHEYVLGFSPGKLDGKVHRIEVRVTVTDAQAGRGATGLRVDHRQGYLARPAETPPHEGIGWMTQDGPTREVAGEIPFAQGLKPTLE